MDSCLQIREMIDWDCSHPDDVNIMALAYGIDAARMLFLDVSSTNAISCCFISNQILHLNILKT